MANIRLLKSLEHLETQDKRKQLAKQLPELAQRIFALNGKYYKGCGFHWNMVKEIGYLLYTVNNYDKKYSFEDQIINDIIFLGLKESVESAENYSP